MPVKAKGVHGQVLLQTGQQSHIRLYIPMVACRGMALWQLQV